MTETTEETNDPMPKRGVDHVDLCTACNALIPVYTKRKILTCAWCAEAYFRRIGGKRQ